MVGQQQSDGSARVAFRVDASAFIGTGHLVRCLALAAELQRLGAACTFLCAACPPALREVVVAQGYEFLELPPAPAANPADAFAIDPVADSANVIDALRTRAGVEWLIVDHYGIDAQWEERVRPHVRHLMVVDDLANRVHRADLLLDQGIQASPLRYRALLPASARTLLGTRFALVRSEFRRARLLLESDSRALRRRVVVFAGGGDPDNATALVLRAWRTLPQPRPPLDVVVSAQHPAKAELMSECSMLGDVVLHVQTNDMPALLSQALLFVGSAGTVSWERCCMGVPALMFSIADNQQDNLRSLATARTGIDLGKAQHLSAARLGAVIRTVLARPGLLRRMSARASRLVDGLGAARVALALCVERLQLRAATADDAADVWPWRNHESTRRHSRSSAAVPLDEHKTWWRWAVDDPKRHFLIGHCGPRDVGVLRFDVEGSRAEVSIYLDPALTGLGLGRALLEAGQRWAAENLAGVDVVEAYVLPENASSLAAFAAVGFRGQGSVLLWKVRRG